MDTISPPGTLNYGEEEARGVFQSGNAVFMRNWPYAWALSQAGDSPVRGKVAVAPLPRGGSNGTRASTLGGWQLARLGNTMIYVTHDQTEAMTLADRLVLIRDGCVAQAGAPLALYHNPESLFAATFLGTPRMNLIPARLTGGRRTSPPWNFRTAVNTRPGWQLGRRSPAHRSPSGSGPKRCS